MRALKLKNRGKTTNVIPGFKFTLGITILMVSLLILIPLASVLVFSFRLTPEEFIKLITAKNVVNAFKTSILCSFIAAFINNVFGLILAWVLVKYEFPGKRILDGMIELPFALPTAVAGISLAHLTVSEGPVGALFAKFGIDIAYTNIGITVAMVFIGIPFVVRSIQPVLEQVENEYEEAAFIMGAGRFETFYRVVLPEIRPALIAGFTMAFARCLGEYGSVVFIAGNKPYETEIAPLMIMGELQEFDYPAATSVALTMLVMAFVILFINAVFQSRASAIISGIR